jgi:1-acyl-sn-glycerol-3-phosphate acyltransferase
VARGRHSVLCGGGIRTGVCSVAIRAGVPIVPVVLIGSAELSRVGPWLPAKRGRLWVAYGQPIPPRAGRSTRATRDALRRALVGAVGELSAELRREFSLADAARRDEYCEPLLMGRSVG